MTKDLTNADLENFQSAYEKTPCADVIARAVQENGVTAASKNFAAKANHDHVFSVEVETGKITNQKKLLVLPINNALSSTLLKIRLNWQSRFKLCILKQKKA
jgi:aminopeptidase C